MAEANQHFKQVVGGARPEVLAALGAALLALEQQRSGAEVDSAPALRQASLELLRWLAGQAGARLTPAQHCFLLSGALADSVTVRDAAGQPRVVELLPPGFYSLLLHECNVTAPAGGMAASILPPPVRWEELAAGSLAPFDFNRPGRFKPHAPGQPRPARPMPAADQPAANPAMPSGHASQAELLALRQELASGQQELAGLLRQLAGAVSGERLGGLLKELAQFTQFVNQAQEQLADPARALQVALPAPERQEAVRAVEQLHRELDATLSALSAVQRGQLHTLDELQRVVLQKSAAVPEPVTAPVAREAGYSAEQLKRIETDAGSMFASVSQYLINHPQRTAYSASRVLLAEHFEKLGAPPEECIATPPRLAAALQRVQALHPNCFPPDDKGEPVLPPIVIEPGVGLVKWLDDRFLLSFVSTDPPRPGAQLSLSPLDQAVLRIYGSYVARGDIWNYRGERLHDSLMAEYAGEVEQKVAVKFTGAEKKLSYGTSAEEKDGASRDDAVRDYVDFVYCVFNGLQLPKRITTRKAGVFLKYCMFRDLPFTVGLTLQLIAGSDALAARAILLRYVPHDQRMLIALCAQALEQNQALQTRYRRDLASMLLAVLGREFMDDARDAGLLGAGGAKAASATAPDAPGDGGEGEPAPAHNYFDL
jgi:hypothetical protein